MNSFEELYQIDVQKHVEKKGRFSYLSWPYAVAELRKRHPEATWTVVKHDGIPFLETSAGVFVEVAVTVNGVTLSQIHPVLNAQNKPIYEPTAFDINTSIQRCLVKAIALHGLGLYIYAGEDLPEVESKPAPKIPATPKITDLNLEPEIVQFLQEFAVEVTQIVTEEGGDAAIRATQAAQLDGDQMTALWNMLDSRTRAAIKKAKEQSKAMHELTTD